MIQYTQRVGYCCEWSSWPWSHHSTRLHVHHFGVSELLSTRALLLNIEQRLMLLHEQISKRVLSACLLGLHLAHLLLISLPISSSVHTLVHELCLLVTQI